MDASWQLGRLAGIDVRVHWTFLLLPVWIYFSNLAAGSGVGAAIAAVGFLLAIFGCVVLHELGHSLMARQFGIATRDITLLPIGGVARLQRMPRSPWQELAIAIAGPAVNVVIATLIFSGLTVLAISDPTFSGFVTFLIQLAWVNVALVVFNMLPAFPMDGGRVLRAVLALALPYATATRVAAGVGQFVAAGLALLGLMTGNLMLVLVAGFVFIAARGEAFMAGRERMRARDYLELDPPDHILSRGDLPELSSLPIVSSQWNASSALGWLSDESIDEFLVSSHGAVIGVVRRNDLRKAVWAGRGTWAIERLLAMEIVPMRGVVSA